MTTFDLEAPGSPPGLTGSKSSKSSSFHSSSLSGAEGLLSDLAHFEDIGLDEDHLPTDQDLYGNENTKRPTSRTASSNMSGSRNHIPATATMRELTNDGKRPSYPNLQRQIDHVLGNGVNHSLKLPRRNGTRRDLSSPSIPSLAIKAMSNLNRSRSPSPSHPTLGLASPRMIPNGDAPRQPGTSPILKARPSRRGSWQPSRKPIQELEDEYHDSDEDLPDDASLWNVPLSPRPPSERSAISPATSTNASANTSPERPISQSSSFTNLGMSAIRSPRPPSAISVKQAFVYDRYSIPSSPAKPTYSRGVSTGMMPDGFCFPKNRAKSWNVALSELSEEAQFLTEALESHAGKSESQQQEAVQSGRSTARPSLEKLSKAKTNVELPPLRISEVMIDPLPVSKEKEKVLSRTRPSWLPPKNQKEEKKHLREYQRMMQSSIQAEKSKAAKDVNTQCVKDDTKSRLLRIWEEHVLPNWDQVIREPRTRELWWRGVAPRSRAQVWEKAIGNELALTEITYVKALQRAKDAERRTAKTCGDELGKEKTWFDAIRRDVKVAFPELSIFQPNGPLYDGLLDVLMAYSMYRSDVGYSHGIHLIAALFALTLSTPSATFLCLCNFLNRPIPLAFLTGDPSGTRKAYSLTVSLLSHKIPRLHSHLFGPRPAGLGLTAHEVFEPMLRTMFLGPGGGLGIDIAARVWDVMLFDGDSTIIRAAVALLGALESRLYGAKEEVLGVLGWGSRNERYLWKVGGEDEFMARVRSAGKEERSKQ